jgi:hypothetical protein
MPVVESAIPVPSKLNLTETFVSLVTLFTSPIRALAAEHHPKKKTKFGKILWKETDENRVVNNKEICTGFDWRRGG